MLVASFNIRVVEDFLFRARSLHIRDVKLFIVHDPAAVRLACEVLGLVTAQVRRDVPPLLIYLREGRAARHRAEVR